MTEPLVKPSPAIYSFLYPIINEVCKQHGYACCLHGSLQKDLDIIAVPWDEDISSISDLVNSVTNAVGGILFNETPIERGHGRLAFWISLGTEIYDPYIDFSVYTILSDANII